MTGTEEGVRIEVAAAVGTIGPLHRRKACACDTSPNATKRMQRIFGDTLINDEAIGLSQPQIREIDKSRSKKIL